VVNLWWNRGELWFVDGHILGLKNMPPIMDLFFLFPFWEYGVWGRPPGLAVEEEVRGEGKGFARQLLIA
jgi:hypothetical protein